MAAGESPTRVPRTWLHETATVSHYYYHYYYRIWTARMARCTLGDPVRQCSTVVLVLFCTESRVAAMMMASGFSLPSSVKVESREPAV